MTELLASAEAALEGNKQPSREVPARLRSDSPVETPGAGAGAEDFNSAPPPTEDNATTPQVPKSKAPERPKRPVPVRGHSHASVLPNFNAAGEPKTAAPIQDDAIFDSVTKKMKLLANNFTNTTRFAIDAELKVLQKRGADPVELLRLKREADGIAANYAKNKNPNQRPISQVLAVNQLEIESKGMAKRARTSHSEYRGTYRGSGPPINPRDL